MALKWKLLIMLVVFIIPICSAAQPNVNDGVTRLVIWNCDPEMAIGWVKWESKPGRGVEYELDGIDVYGRSIIVYETTPGWYGITQYNYRKDMVYDYANVEVKPGETKIVKFSCKPEEEF